MIYVNKQSGSNMVGVSDRVREALDELNGQLTKGKLGIRIDNADFIRQVISNLRSDTLYGMALAVIVLVVFLQSFRSTFVIAVTIPLCILATFIMIFFQGFTLNIVSFGGLALGIGMLVDNSIVVMESVYVKREQGLSPKEAAIEGTEEVATAIIASTLTSLIVFLPMLFIVGMTGIMLYQLAWVVCFSQAFTLFIGLTLTPMLCAHWIGELDPEELDKTRKWSPIAWMHRVNQWLLSGMEKSYAWGLKTCMRFPGLVGTALLACFCATLGLVPFVGSELMPKTDEGSVRVDAEMTPGIQLEELTQKTLKLEEAIKSLPET
jgi:HAE1 family hydrophobic/amphiphilic exporter-1